MRVCIVGMHYAPEPSGNAPYTTGLARGLARRGHDVRVITGVPHYPDWTVTEGYRRWVSEGSESGVLVRRLRHYVPSRPTNSRRVLMELSFGGRALGQGHFGHPDALLTVSPALFSTAMVVARLRRSAKRPALGVWVQDVYSAGLVETASATGAVAGAVARMESAVMRQVDGVAVIHDRFRRRLTEGLNVPDEKVQVIRNWTHLERVQIGDRSAVRRQMGWRGDEVIALHAGNMGVKQGLDNLVEAARIADEKRLPVRFVLLGGGNQRARLQQLGRGLDRLQFLASLPADEYQEVLAAADVLVVNELPGLSEMSVPSKLTSYMTTGNPILAATEADSVTAEEVLAAGAGDLVPAGNPQALVQGALRLGEDSERSAKLGKAGIRYCEQVLSKQAAIDHFEDWLMRLTSSHRERIGSNLD